MDLIIQVNITPIKCASIRDNVCKPDQGFSMGDLLMLLNVTRCMVWLLLVYSTLDDWYYVRGFWRDWYVMIKGSCSKTVILMLQTWWYY